MLRFGYSMSDRPQQYYERQVVSTHYSCLYNLNLRILMLKKQNADLEDHRDRCDLAFDAVYAASPRRRFGE
jgi:hypothetical protein